MLWTPNTPSSTRHPTKCPPSRLPSLSRLPSSRPPQLCFQHETGSKVLLVCMIHKGWNGDGITQLMLAPTMYPNANEDETHKYTNHLPPSRVVCPIQSPDSSSFWPASFYPTISGSHCYCHSILPIFFLFLVKSFSVLFFFFLHYKRQWTYAWLNEKRFEGRDVQTSWHLWPAGMMIDAWIPLYITSFLNWSPGNWI